MADRKTDQDQMRSINRALNSEERAEFFTKFRSFIKNYRVNDKPLLEQLRNNIAVISDEVTLSEVKADLKLPAEVESFNDVFRVLYLKFALGYLRDRDRVQIPVISFKATPNGKAVEIFY